ncbi:SDR family NAD(P)-dependent oxidoreductase [Halosolutus gelatinilyticus]|uniref:SDR family NAD(P)-dependent oxidoreductase n=1 Tax=Halosolutus gelatinilyticus TaxID=2931975 RepID=UPI001FF35CAE|nr:SDR family oxidoreductase [Halosolutus gelatinilyticus]
MLDGTTAFVTGASQNIGRQIALTFADRGANVAVAARSDGIDETVDLVDDADRVLAVETDVTDSDSVARSIEETVETFGGLDCLVNNAGIAGPTAPIEDTPIEEWERTLDVNLLGQVRTVRAAVPHLRESPRGRIINVSSTAAKDVIPSRAPYNASKMAVIALTRSLALDLGDDGITVNAICPGATRGKRIERSISEQSEKLGLSFEETKERLFTGNAALGALIEERDTADLAAFLASEDARHISGQDINVDAGSCWE